MRKLIQIYTGGVSGRNISVQQIVQKLELVQKAGLDGIIVGWSLEKQIYEWLRDYTKERGIELYLWFQVLSEFKRLGGFTAVETLYVTGMKSFPFIVPAIRIRLSPYAIFMKPILRKLRSMAFC